MAGGGAILGRAFSGFGKSYADQTNERKKRELEQQRLRQQEEQFRASLALQQQQLAATNRRNESLDAFMMKRGEREDARLGAQDARAAESAYWDNIQKKAILGDPTLLQKEQQARASRLDLELGQNESALKDMPLESRRRHILTRLDETNLDKANIETKVAGMNFEDAQRLKPFRDKLVEAQSREADARAKMAELDVNDAPSAIERKKIKEHIDILHGNASMMAQLAQIQIAAQNSHLQTIELNDRALNELSNRWVDLVTRAQIAPNDATKLITDFYKTGYGIINKDIASRTGASPMEHAELMKWYADAAPKILKGSPEEVRQVMGELPAVTQKFMGAFESFGRDQAPKGIGPSGIPLRPTEDETQPPPAKPAGKSFTFQQWKERNPGRENTTAEATTLDTDSVQRLVFSKPGLKDATMKAIKAYYDFDPESNLEASNTEEDMAAWLKERLNQRTDIKGSPAVRAAKLLEEMKGVGRILPKGAAAPAGGTTPGEGEGRTSGEIPAPGGVRRYTSGQ